MRLKTVEELTSREVSLTLNFASVYVEAGFKQVFEAELSAFLNETWAARSLEETERLRAAAQDNSASAVPGSRLKTQQGQYFAPLVEVVRLVVNDAPQEGLSWSGPLEPEGPVRNAKPTPPPVEVALQGEEFFLPFLSMQQWMIVGGFVALVFLCCCGYFSYTCLLKLQWRMQQRQYKKDAAAAEAMGLDVDGSPRSPGRSLSPRSPGRRGSPGGSPASPGRRVSVGSSPASPGSPGSPGLRGSMGPMGDISSPHGILSEQRRGTPGSPRGSVSPRLKKGEAEKQKKLREKIKKLGDLAGHRTLSTAAKQALESEQEKKKKDEKEAKKAARGSMFGRRRKKKQGDDGDSPRGDSPEGSPRDHSPGHSPRGEGSDSSRKGGVKGFFTRRRQKGSPGVDTSPRSPASPGSSGPPSPTGKSRSPSPGGGSEHS